MSSVKQDTNVLHPPENEDSFKRTEGYEIPSLTTHQLSAIEIVPLEEDLSLPSLSECLSRVEAKNEYKRVRDNESERLEAWIQNKKASIQKEATELSPLEAALEQVTNTRSRARKLTDQVDMLSDSIDTSEAEDTIRVTRSISRSQSVSSRNATRPPSPELSTPPSTESTTSTSTKDVDALIVGKINQRSSRSQFKTPTNASQMVSLSALLDPANATPTQKLDFQRGQIDPDDLHISETILGEGQLGIVRLGFYKGLFVACKSKRQFTRSDVFSVQAKREMKFAAKLSACRYINRYIGWVSCNRNRVEEKNAQYGREKQFLYIVQRFVSNGDARGYLEKRVSSFKPQEVLQASICLFAALTDAHELNIGIVDLKLENFLIDSSGAGWLTDFGSCIEFTKSREVIDLNVHKVAWTEHVAPPEMLGKHHFSKASDVFMATLIIAELMTADISDIEFQNNILKRNPITGRVRFTSTHIDPIYEDYFMLLKQGLSNNPDSRPTAAAALEYLLLMKE